MIRIHQKFWKLLLKRKVMLISLIVLLITLPIFFLVTKYKSNAEASWYDGNWSHRKQLTFNNSAQASNLSNFPVMIKLTSSNFPFSQAKNDGSDIRFTDSNGSTLIPYEIESYDSTAQTATLWVNVPQIDSSSSTDSIYVYWGNPKASDAQSADNTWNSNYKGVYHLKDNAATTTVTDSSGNGNNLTSSENTNNGFYQSAGKVGGGFLTAGTPTYITNQSGSNISEMYPDIILDSSGYPVITYYNQTNGDLVLVHCNDKECKGENETVNTVDSTGTTGLYPSIRLDGNGYPMIAYYISGSNDLKYVHCNDVNCAGGNETFSVIDATSNVGAYPRMVLDGSGYPVIAYYYSTGADVKLVHCGNADCNSGNTINTLDSAGTVGNELHGTDLVLDASGYPVISYYDTTNTELKVIHCNDANCAGANESVVSPLSTLAESLGRFTAIELDENGYPMIAYYNATDTDLEFIHCDDANCAGDESPTIIKLDTSTNSYFASMEKDISGNPVIFESSSGSYPRVYFCANTNCSSSTFTDLARYNQNGSYYPNFKLDTNNNVYATTYSRGITGDYDTILYTTSHKLDQAYDPDFDFGTGNFSISAWFKSSGMVQQNTILSRYDADQGYRLWLNYAGQPCFGIDDDASWGPDDSACASNSQVITNVDNGNASNINWTSMKLDANGYPVIAYYDYAGGQLNLEIIHCNDANCTGGDESFASLDATGDVGMTPSLVLDGNGYPVVAYHDNTNQNLKIVHCGNANCSSGNVVNTVDSSADNVGDYPTLKLDANGYPVISYYDTTNTSVKLARCNDANCDGVGESIVTLVNDENDMVRHGSESLQLDTSGYPMVAYFDNTNGDLKYIHCNDINCDGVGETKTTIETTNNVGDFASMVLDSSGYPVIAYFDATNLDLRLVHCGNADCSSGNTASAINSINNGDAGYYGIDIELNASGNPVILSTQLASWSTILTVCNDVNCSGGDETNSIIRGQTTSYQTHSLALDINNFPVITYVENWSDIRLIHMDNATTYSETGNYDDGEWHHLVGVKNGTSSISLYVDGVLVGSDVTLAAAGTLTGNSASLNLAEEITNNLSTNNWSGYIDEVQIDNTTRSADWIAAQYLSESNTFVSFGPIQTSPRGDNPIAYWKFDEGQGVVANNTVWEKTGTTTNLMPNPSLETNTTGWVYGGGNGSLSRITTDRVYGGSSGSVVGATDYAWSRSRYNGMSVSSSTTYTLSGYVKAGSAGAVGKTIILGLIGNNSGESTGGTTTLTNSWQRVSIQKTTNASDTTLDAEVIWNNNSGGDTFYFDGIQLELSGTTHLYCDGSLSGRGSHAWSGTAHASASTCDAGTDGQINSAVWRTKDQCINGKCLYFDGTGDNVEIGATKFDSLNNATIETWFKYTGTFDTNRALWGHYKDGSNRQQLFVGYPGGWGNKLVFENIAGGVNRGITSNTALSAGNWYHAAISCGVDGMKMYINGAIQTTTSATTDCLSTISGTISNSIGQASSGSMTFNGFIDEFKIFPYVRTPIQIKNDFNSRGSTLGLSAQLGVSKESSSAFSNGLVGHWKMDENTGTTTSDASGNTNASTFYHEAAWSNGKFFSGVTFDGYDDVLKTPSTTGDELNPANAVSVSTWVNLTTAKSNSYIATKGWGDNYELFLNNDRTITFRIVNTPSSDQQTATTTTTLNTGTWYHIVGTYDKEFLRVYINGQLSASSSYNKTIYQGGQSFAIGGIPHMETSYFNNGFIGIIDETRVYNRALSTKEVLDLYVWKPEAIAYYSFNEGSGPYAVDSSGNGLNATWAGSSNHYGTGKFGKAANLPTTGDYAYSNNNSLNIGTNDFTISSWIKTSNGSRAYIIDKGAGDGLNGYRFETGTDFKLLALIGGPSSYVAVTGSKVINDGLWHHVGVTFIRNGDAQIYVDGSPSGAPVNISSFNGVSIANSSNFAIGSSGGGAGTRFIGAIDDVRIYNYARTSGQITEDMNAGHPLGGSPISSQVGYWKFDEGFESTANNSGNGGSTLNGTLDNATWSMNGKYGKAINCELDNSAEVDIGSSTVSNETELTVSAWINPESYTTNGGIIGEGGAYRLFITTAGKLQFFVNGNPSDTGSTLTSSNNVIVNGVWQHVAAVWNGSNSTWGLYYNGKRIADNGVVNNTTSLDGVDSDNPVICNYWNNYASARFDGLIDEVKLYSSALTSDEIKLDYNRGSAMVLGTLSDTSGTGGTVGDSSNSSAYCVPGDTNSCASPVLELKMDEKTGTSTTYDTSGNAIDATLYASPAWTTGKFGSGLSFNGTTQRMTTVANPLTNFSAAGQYTIESWVKLDQYQPNGGTGGCCGSRIAYNNSGDGGFDWRIWNNGVVSFYRPTTWCAASSTQTVPLNQWVHLSATYNNQQVYLYMNGRQIASTNSCNYLDSSVGLTFNYPGGNHGLYGDMDNIQIYNYARTPAQIAWDYNRGGPIGYWKLDECTGTTANDASGNGNTGTITIGATGTNTSAGTCTGSAGEAWKDGATGKFNSSLEFDGTDDSINLGNQTTINNLTTKTISFWTYLNSQVGAGGVGSHWLNKGDSGAGWFVATDPGNSRNIYGQHFGAGTAGRWSFPQFSTSQWHHVVVAYDRSSILNDPTIYVDGVRQSVTEYSTPTGTAGDDSANSLLVSKSPGNDRFVNGQIDDVRIYNYALTPQQVKQVMNEGAGIRFGPSSGNL